MGLHGGYARVLGGVGVETQITHHPEGTRQITQMQGAGCLYRALGRQLGSGRFGY